MSTNTRDDRHEMTVIQRLAALGVALFTCLAAAPAWAQDDAGVETRLGAMFHRSMAHWRYDYAAMPTGKAGVACIPWETIDETYLDEAIFEALGFSYSTATDETAIRIATQGCEQMRAAKKLTDCACETILLADAVVLAAP